MLDLFKQYFKVIGYTLTGLAFGFAFFFLFLNFYHYLELRREFNFNAITDSYVQTLDEKLATISNNIAAFSGSNYSGELSAPNATKIKKSLNNCVSLFKNDEITDIRNKSSINIIDVYNLRESYETSIASQCLINNFIWLTTAKDDGFGNDFIESNQGFFTSEITNLIRDTDYIKKELLNNSSYFFNTDISSASVKDTTRDSFYLVMSSYNKAADFLVNLSEWYKDAVTTTSTPVVTPDLGEVE